MNLPRSVLRPTFWKLEVIQIQVLVALAVYIIFFTGQFSDDALLWLVGDAVFVSPTISVFAILMRRRRIQNFCAELLPSAGSDSAAAHAPLKVRILNYPFFEGVSVFLRWVLGGGGVLGLLSFQVQLSFHNVAAFCGTICLVIPLSVTYSYLVMENGLAPLLREPAIARVSGGEGILRFKTTVRIFCIVFSVAVIPLAVLSALLVLQSAKMVELAGFGYHLGFLSLLTLAAIGLCLKEMASNIDRTVESLERGLQAIRDGELTEKPIPMLATNEMGTLSEYLNLVRDRVKGMIQEIQTAAAATVGFSERLAAGSQTLSAGTEQMSQQTQSIAASSNQLGQNLELVSSSIEEMSIAVGDVARRSAQAAVTTDNANTRTEEARRVVRLLGDNAKQIGKVIESIADIADQTNLLALNAAIEAADAGEFGTRFAVVAAEVKVLAHQTAVSSDDVRGRIESIQKSAGETVRAIESIDEIIQQLKEMNSAVASFVEEQSIASREISSNALHAAQSSAEMARNVSSVSSVVTEEAEEAAAISRLAADLKSMARHLGESAAHFRT